MLPNEDVFSVQAISVLPDWIVRSCSDVDCGHKVDLYDIHNVTVVYHTTSQLLQSTRKSVKPRCRRMNDPFVSHMHRCHYSDRQSRHTLLVSFHFKVP